jgi:hypothetical protein
VPRGTATLDSVLLAVALPTPFVIKGDYDMGFAARGSMHQRKYKIERNGFDGPIAISLADRQARHLQGVTAASLVVPAGVSDFTFPVLLPPWMETGRTCRVCVMGVGVIKDKDGTEHKVSFSSVGQNEQLVAVVGPGKLALELDRASVSLPPGKDVEVGVRIKRATGIDGPVRVELILPGHIKGVTSAAVTIPAGKDEGRLRMRGAESAGPFNMPLTVRATLVHLDRPIIAEGRLEVAKHGD